MPTSDVISASCAGSKRLARAWPTAATARASTAEATSASSACASTRPRCAASTARACTRRPTPAKPVPASEFGVRARIRFYVRENRIRALTPNSGLQHAFFVKARESPRRIVFLLERVVGGAAVAAVKVLLAEEAVRVERLDAAELAHLLLDQPVEVAGRVRFARALHVPEAEVDVPRALDRIQDEAPGIALGADRADPLRPQADFARIELQELDRARERDVDVLDHRLGVQAEQPLDFLRRADAAVPAHDPGVGLRAEPRFPIDELPQKRVLREHVLRAPEPVGVPAPQIVLHREVVLPLLGDRAVVDALVRVVARVRRGLAEAAERDE